MHRSDENVRRYPTTLAIRLPKDLKKALFDRATAADRTPSAVVRRLIREHLDSALAEASP
jgi:predicted transcriptional regulator